MSLNNLYSHPLLNPPPAGRTLKQCSAKIEPLLLKIPDKPAMSD